MFNVRCSMFTLIVVLACAGHSASLAQTPAGLPSSGLCELRIKGHSILSLTLLSRTVSEHGSGQTFARPGASVWLPPDSYQVLAVELEGGYEYANDFVRDSQWLEVSPDKPCELDVGAPLLLRVTAGRHGKFLEMDCDLVDSAGRTYMWTDAADVRPAPPQFTVYRNDQVQGSGSFEYG
jgi:hypothetical protein